MALHISCGELCP